MRTLLTIAIILAISIFAYVDSKSKNEFKNNLREHTNMNGFLDVRVASQSLVGDGIVILTPMSCPRNQAVISEKKADKIIAALAERGIPARKTNSINASIDLGDSNKQDKKENNKVSKRVAFGINQKPPLVFVNGKVKSDPYLHDILAEYKENTK